jgi:hypothetical protein
MSSASRWTARFRVPPTGGDSRQKREPTFSVVIAAYQAAETIGDAIESVLQQTLAPSEIIVCDDGSTDALDAALRPYRDQIHYIRKKRGGPASARNVAARAASCEFVTILDADDAYLPERIEAFHALALARPDLDILSTDAYYERDGRTVGLFSTLTPFETDDQRSAILDRCFCAWPALRRERLLAAGGFDEALATADDWECVIRLIFSGSKAGFVGEPLYAYRLTPGSVTADRVETLCERLAMLEAQRQRLSLSPSEEAALDRALARQRRSLLLAEADASLRLRRPDARSKALRVLRARNVPVQLRLRALASIVAPGAVRRALERRSAVCKKEGNGRELSGDAHA